MNEGRVETGLNEETAVQLRQARQRADPTSGTALQTLLSLFRRGSDPYAGADMPTVRRAVGVLLAIHTLLAPAFVLLSSPSSELPATRGAWVLLGAVVAGSGLSAAWVVRDRPRVTFNRLLAMSYLGVLGTFLLTFGTGQLVPVGLLFLVWVGCAAVQPPRRGLGLVTCLTGATVASTLLGAPRGETREALFWAVLFAALGVLLMGYVSYVRRQRIELRSEESEARALADAATQRVRDLQWVTDATLAHLQLEELLGELLDRILKVFGLGTGAVVLCEPGVRAFTYASSRGIDAENGTPVSESDAARIPKRAASATRPFVLDRLDTSDPFEAVLAEAGVRSVIAAPLQVGDDVLGVLCVGARGHDRFDDHDAAFLHLVGGRVALAVDRTRIFESQRDIAETLQRSLLADELPRITGASMAVRYLPGGAGVQVGGDWYDVLDLGDGRIGVAIGDVVGRGVRAAALMGKLRTALQAFSLDGHDPAAVLARLHLMLEAEPGSPIATVLYAVLDPEDATVEFANAGHLAPIVREDERGTRFLSVAQSPPLGAVAYTRFELQRAQLDPRATLVLFTDGLVERRGVSLAAQLESLRRTVATGPAKPEALCDEVIRAMQNDDELEDDVALLAVALEPLPDRGFALDFPAEPEMLANLRTVIERWLRAIGAGPTDIYAVKAATMEACANSIEHAYRPGDAAFRVEFQNLDGDVTVTVRDFGCWRDQRGTDRGRGLLLMEALMDSSEVMRSPEGSTVRLRRRIEKVAAG